MTDSDRLLTPEERARLDRETDPLVRLVADLAECRLDPGSLSAARFYRWIVREMRASERPPERLTPERVEQSRARVLARFHAARLGVRDGGAAPAVREPRADRASPGVPDIVPDPESRGGSAPWVELPVAAGVGREIWDEPCERWVELPHPLPRGEYIALSVTGDSMTPLVHAGDVVLVRLGGVVERQSVVVARHPDDGYLLKEVGRLGRREIELRSLNREYPPVRIPRSARLIVGTVVLRWCAHGGRAGRGSAAS
jgi:hypothetical protein